jgi:hypothetical protein
MRLTRASGRYIWSSGERKFKIGVSTRNMIDRQIKLRQRRIDILVGGILLGGLVVISCIQLAAQNDPAEPLKGRPSPKLLPRPAQAIPRQAVDENSMRVLVEQLAACGTRNSLSSWSDPKRGVGCGRDRVMARLNDISKQSGGKLRVVVDRFDARSVRTGNTPAPLENVYGILPGTDPRLSKTAFIVSGHFDSRASDVMDPHLDAPGADDDASGVAVSIECARLLSQERENEQGAYRATLVFAAVSGEEQGLLGGSRLLEWARQQGYTVGGMLDDDIVGADPAPGAPHRVRLFSGNGDRDDSDSPSREMARAIEEIDGREAIRLVFRIDRVGRGGDHYPFYLAGLPAVRFTEPLEDYRHQHQTPRTENGVEYGDFTKYLNYRFMGNVARANSEALRELSLAPAPPGEPKLAGGVSPDAKIGWSAVDDADRAGFEILWRETTEPRWNVYEFAREASETALYGVSTDNHFFAVRAVGKNGARSIAVPADDNQRTPPPASGAPQK